MAEKFNLELDFGSVTPIDMDGTLYAHPVDESTFKLAEELSTEGRYFTIIDTAHEFKSPYVISRGAEIIGVDAIRRYFKI